MCTPSFFPDSKSSILGLSNNVSFVSEFLCENSQKEKFLTLADPEKGSPSNLRWSQNQYQFHQTSLKFHYLCEINLAFDSVVVSWFETIFLIPFLQLWLHYREKILLNFHL